MKRAAFMPVLASWGTARTTAMCLVIAALCSGTVRADPLPTPVSPPVESHSPIPSMPGQASSKNVEKTLPEVTIEAQREALEHRMDSFVRRITQDPRFRDESIPRWRAPVCFAVAGLPTREGAFVLERLSRIASSAGARVGRRGCEYNFYVVFTAEPNKLLQRIFRLHRRVFDQGQGLPAIQRFLSPSKPQAVRVWHNVTVVTKDGIPINVDAACGSISVSGGGGVPVSCQYYPLRITRYDVFDFSFALVIVDTTFPKGVKLGQVADFTAMVGLADIDPDADIGDAPSILRLFATSPDVPPSGLTTWDQAFLSALYHTDQSSSTQRSQIVVRMVHDVSP